MHPFARRWRELAVTRTLGRAGVKAYGDDGFGLVLSIESLDPHYFTDAVLAGQAAASILSAEGEWMYATIRDLGQEVLDEVPAPAEHRLARPLLCAIILHPVALERASRLFLALRAA